MFKVEGMVENLLKNIDFFFSIFKLDGGILSWNGDTEDVLTIQGQIGEIYPQSTGKLNISLFQPYFSTCLSLKSCPPTPIKALFLEGTSAGLSAHKVWRLQIENCSLPKHLNFFSHISSIIGKNTPCG